MESLAVVILCVGVLMRKLSFQNFSYYFLVLFIVSKLLFSQSYAFALIACLFTIISGIVVNNNYAKKTPFSNHGIFAAGQIVVFVVVGLGLTYYMFKGQEFGLVVSEFQLEGESIRSYYSYSGIVLVLVYSLVVLRRMSVWKK